jgi:hypothetical protein
MVVAAADAEYGHSIMVATLTQIITFKRPASMVATVPWKHGTYPNLFHPDATQLSFLWTDLSSHQKTYNPPHLVSDWQE